MFMLHSREHESVDALCVVSDPEDPETRPARSVFDISRGNRVGNPTFQLFFKVGMATKKWDFPLLSFSGRASGGVKLRGKRFGTA